MRVLAAGSTGTIGSRFRSAAGSRGARQRRPHPLTEPGHRPGRHRRCPRPRRTDPRRTDPRRGARHTDTAIPASPDPNRSPDRLLAATAPWGGPWLPTSYKQKFRKGAWPIFPHPPGQPRPTSAHGSTRVRKARRSSMPRSESSRKTPCPAPGRTCSSAAPSGSAAADGRDGGDGIVLAVHGQGGADHGNDLRELGGPSRHRLERRMGGARTAVQRHDHGPLGHSRPIGDESGAPTSKYRCTSPMPIRIRSIQFRAGQWRT